MFRLLFVLTILFCGVSSGNKVTPIPVNVWKCCRLGEALQRVDNDDEGYKCVPGMGGSKTWIPLVYAPKRKMYFPRNVSPPHWNIIEKQTPTCTYPMKQTILKSSPTQSNYIVFANGSLWLHEFTMMLPPTSFCIDADAAVVCLEKEEKIPANVSEKDMALVKKTVKVKKCCGDGAVFSESGKCISTKSPVDIAPEDFILEDDDGENGTFGVQIQSGLLAFPECNQSDLAITSLKEISLLQDGSLKFTKYAGVYLAKGEYCVDRVIEYSSSVKIIACNTPGVTIESNDPPKSLYSDVRLTIFPICLLISTAFLLATLAAGFLLPTSHHALHWRCQTHYIGCLLIGDFILAITQLAGTSIAKTACVTLATFMHFFFLAAFFWLNTMCFNIWWTFRDFRPTSLEKRQEVCRLRVYEVFAWGGPLLIAGVAAILDHLPADPLSPFLRPRFGEKQCWFYGDMEIFTFFFGPIGILLFVNLMLFASTARQLTCGLWKREDVKSTTERAALGRVCMKLVVVMGITWVADVISWAAGGPSYVWYITDLINALQGVLIFIVIGCQPQVWAAVKKFWCLKKLQSNVTNTTGAPMHSSSQGLPSMGESITNNTVANTTSNARIPMETVC